MEAAGVRERAYLIEKVVDIGGPLPSSKKKFNRVISLQQFAQIQN